mmetsp:Transcript_10025/g.14073  ORF Transcript_10025/g.14073 Transcript_10025/m.14073 type:complete len:240 (+) Transcript_10025:64-783(+)
MTTYSSPPSPTPPIDNDNENSSISSDEDSSTKAFMLSVARLTMAGFGGALVGMSLARRGLGNVPAASLARKRLGSELPNAWALACMAFVGLIEISRAASPTSLLLDIAGVSQASSLSSDHNAHSVSGDDGLSATSIQAIRTIGDYTLGGAIAGAAFRGLPSGKRTPSVGGFGSTTAPLRFSSRLGPGLALGFVAGVLQFGADYTEQLASDQYREEITNVEEEQDKDYVIVDRLDGDSRT